MIGQIYWDIILKQHAHLFKGAISAKFVFMDDNAHSHGANIVHEYLQSEDITLYEMVSILTLFESNIAYGTYLADELRPVNHFLVCTGTSENTAC